MRKLNMNEYKDEDKKAKKQHKALRTLKKNKRYAWVCGSTIAD